MPTTLTADPDRFVAMAAAWQAITSPAPTAVPAGWYDAIAGMNAAKDHLVAQRQWVSGPSSIMSVLGLSRNEVVNCRMVRWLLDPLGRHGIGTAMLRALGDELGVEVNRPEAATVEAEVAQPGTAELVTEGITATRADLVITLPDGQIVVEAKIDAGEGRLQAARLEQHWRDAALVFLTVRGDSPPSTATDRSRWQPLTWRWIADVAAAAVESVDSGHPAMDEQIRASRDAVRLWARSARRTLV